MFQATKQFLWRQNGKFIWNCILKYKRVLKKQKNQPIPIASSLDTFIPGIYHFPNLWPDFLLVLNDNTVPGESRESHFLWKGIGKRHAYSCESLL